MAVFRQASLSSLDSNEKAAEQLNNSHSSPRTHKKQLLDITNNDSELTPPLKSSSRPSGTLPAAPTQRVSSDHAQHERTDTPPPSSLTIQQQQLEEITAERDALRRQITALEDRHQTHLESLMAQAEEQEKIVSELREENAALQSSLQSHRHVSRG